jgi:glycerol-3-phosphate dehydrogenase subunit B
VSGTYDVVVIGGGMSGLMAAIPLAERGRRVAVISKGDPVCCLSTGCVDVFSKGEDPVTGITSLPEHHPYRLVGVDGVKESLHIFQKIMEEAGLPYVGDCHVNRKIMTPLGTDKTTCLVPRTMELAECDPDEYIHVVSFKGIKDFYPSYITSGHANSGYSIFDAGVSSTSAIAERFEEKAFRQDFVSWLGNLSLPDGKIAFPAVLGTRSSMAIFNEISDRLGRDIFEIPTIPPSIPGERLFTSLKNLLLEKGGSLYWGKEIASVEKLDGKIEAVTLSKLGRSTRVQGTLFILATGSFVSGGLYASMDDVKETVFDLPTYLPGERKNWFNRNFFIPGHTIEKAGIRVDSTLRPLDSEFSNLFVCGSILAFTEVMKYGCGHGTAIATGVAAANMCEELL